MKVNKSLRQPNFLYIGPAKGGSTWIFRALSDHPQVYIPPAKGLFFFDQNYHRGLDWYLGHFNPASEDQLALGEISHFYLYSAEALNRIKQDLPDVKVFVCLRNPVERTISAYQFMRRNESFKGSFEEALAAHPNMLERSCYAPSLNAWFEALPREQIGVFFFDDLKKDPHEFARSLYLFLGVDADHDFTHASERVLPASKTRFPGVGRLLKGGAILAKKFGAYNLVGKAKSAGVIKALYKPLNSSERFQPTEEQVQWLKTYFSEDVETLSKLTGRELQAWR